MGCGISGVPRTPASSRGNDGAGGDTARSPGEGMRRGLSTVQLGSPRLHRLALLQLPEKIGAEQALRRLLIYASVAGKTTATENRETDQANDPFPTFFGNSK